MRSQHLAGRRRRVLMSGIVGGAALLLAIAGCGAPSEGSSVPAPAAGTQPAAATTATSIALTLPDRIGPLTKAIDQTAAQTALESLKKSSYRQSVAAFYVDGADQSHSVLIAGLVAEGANAPTAADLDTLIQLRVAPDSTAQPTVVDNLAVGGAAKCIDSSTRTAKSYDCGWFKESALLLAAFTNIEPAKAASLMPEILAATVKP